MISPYATRHVSIGFRTVFLNRLRLLVLCVLALGLSACASMLDPGPAPARLQLQPAMPGPMAGKPSGKQLVVAMPLAGRDIDTDSIALVRGDHVTGDHGPNGRGAIDGASAWASPGSELLIHWPHAIRSR